MSIRELLKKTGDIYVSLGGDNGEEKIVGALKPNQNSKDFECADRQSELIEGDGSLLNPFQFVGAGDVSPHYVAIRLWSQTAPGKFITVNDWVLRVTSSGVLAKDGTFTFLEERDNKADEQV